MNCFASDTSVLCLYRWAVFSKIVACLVVDNIFARILEYIRVAFPFGRLFCLKKWEFIFWIFFRAFVDTVDILESILQPWKLLMDCKRTYLWYTFTNFYSWLNSYLWSWGLIIVCNLRRPRFYLLHPGSWKRASVDFNIFISVQRQFLVHRPNKILISRYYKFVN